jgi:hypothetical protein
MNENAALSRPTQGVKLLNRASTNARQPLRPLWTDYNNYFTRQGAVKSAVTPRAVPAQMRRTSSHELVPVCAKSDEMDGLRIRQAALAAGTAASGPDRARACTPRENADHCSALTTISVPRASSAVAVSLVVVNSSVLLLGFKRPHQAPTRAIARPDASGVSVRARCRRRRRVRRRRGSRAARGSGGGAEGSRTRALLERQGLA